MAEQPEYLTVFRSADGSAETDAARVQAMLTEAGIEAVLADDDVRAVPVGAYEVRVPAAQAVRAEELIATVPLEGVDPSHGLDLVTVFASENVDAEMEGMAIKGLLESSGIEAIIIGSATLPSLPFEVKVARQQADNARRRLVEAQAEGPKAAEDEVREQEEALGRQSGA